MSWLMQIIQLMLLIHAYTVRQKTTKISEGMYIDWAAPQPPQAGCRFGPGSPRDYR
jgi:hypothetical protein